MGEAERSAERRVASRIAIVDDHELVSLALAERIREREGLTYVGQAETVPALLSSVEAAELVLLDLNLRDGSTPSENAEQLSAWGAEVLVLTAGENPYFMRDVSRAGVLGILRKSMPSDEIVDMIAVAAAGNPVITSEWAAAAESDPELMAAPLTDREREVLGLYASGLGAKAVASKLSVSETTVLDHIRRIRGVYAQLHRPAHTKVDLYRRGMEDGYLPIPGTS